MTSSMPSSRCESSTISSTRNSVRILIYFLMPPDVGNSSRLRSTPLSNKWTHHYIISSHALSPDVLGLPVVAAPTDEDAGDVILEDDVFRVAQFICEREAARSETERVMKRFDPKQTGRITRNQWDAVLKEECAKLTLTK